MTEFSSETAHSAEFWDERYSGPGHVWSGRPNQRLVEQVEALPAGFALDIGSGEGADAVWLAEQGWTVVAVDISAAALDKAREHVARTAPAEIAGHISWEQVDVRSWEPAPDTFDLVSMQHVHLPRKILAEVQRRLAPAVRPGGTLLIVNHDPLDLDTEAGRPDIAELFLTAPETAATLDPSKWRVEVAQASVRPFAHGDAPPMTVYDAVVRAIRI